MCTSWGQENSPVSERKGRGKQRDDQLGRCRPGIDKRMRNKRNFGRKKYGRRWGAREDEAKEGCYGRERSRCR
ncbi:hypothetical protein BJY01DRAFT_67505 [Aspergillus pseudoustus]|uniref:Uncharacterized protein n=1 Tax=Aspergillus pseudoustus TaxID=1810923 RepID=A0ABR4J6R1_9EURO